MKRQNDFYEKNSEALMKEADSLVVQIKLLKVNYSMNEIVKMIHRDSSASLERSGLFEKASCSKSCSFCCHDTILMPLIEANYVASEIKRRGIKGNKRRIKLQSLNQPIKWIDKACPYLLDENSNGERLCSIYEFRPHVCRTHNSIEPVEFCNKEKYPNRTIAEGRAIEIEAIPIALMKLYMEETKDGYYPMIPIHKLKV